MTRTFCTGRMCALVCVSAPPARAQSAPPAGPLFDNLGTHHYDITPSMPLTQRYFDQGLRLYYGFNHAEAIRAFQEAARRDPDCAMCYWGIALALGPNINAPMERDMPPTHRRIGPRSTRHTHVRSGKSFGSIPTISRPRRSMPKR